MGLGKNRVRALVKTNTCVMKRCVSQEMLNVDDTQVLHYPCGMHVAIDMMRSSR